MSDSHNLSFHYKWGYRTKQSTQSDLFSRTSKNKIIEMDEMIPTLNRLENDSVVTQSVLERRQCRLKQYP